MTLRDVAWRNHRLIAQLQFVTITNNQKDFLALVDSGAQLNLISEDLVESLQVEQSLRCDICNFRGVGNDKMKIDMWILVKLDLANGATVRVPLAVVKQMENMVILGLPFLIQVKARIDPRNQLLELPAGPLQMINNMQSPARAFIIEVTEEVKSLVDKAIISEKAKTRLLEILRIYVDLYANMRTGQVQGLSHHIRLTTPRPIASRPRPNTEEHGKAIMQEVRKMLDTKVIRASESPYSSEIVMIKKKTGEWRMCIDYRPLNKVTVDDKYQIPRITDLLFSIKGSKYFVALDLRSGYWQIPMDESCRAYTAFRTPEGLFEFLVMPFGLKNAPATFQRCMDFILGDLRYKNVSVYLDDILIHHSDEMECLKLLETVFKRLLLAGLTINLPKCTFFPKALKYLGHIIQGGILRPNLARVNTLDAIKAPCTVTELRAVLGLIGYFQSYIPRYSATVIPLTNLLKGKSKGAKKAAIQWTPECNSALKMVIEKLKESTLTLPIDEDKFVIETDASDLAIGGVLTVDRGEGRQPVYFVNKKLSGAQLNWTIREKEAYAIIHSLQKFDRFIRPKPFVVITDNQSLKWLFDAKSGKLARWAVIMR